MANNKDLSRSLKLNISQKGAKETAQDVSKIADSYEQLNQTAAQTRKATEAYDKALAQIARKGSLSALAQQATEGAISADDLRKSLIAIGASSSEVASVYKEIDKLTAKQDDARAATVRLNEEIEQTAKTASTLDDRLRAFDEQNSLVRRRVGGLGDIDTGAQTLAGGLRTFGGGDAANVVSGAGELFAVAEGAAQLKAASKDLPAQLSAAAKAIGPTGIGLGAAMLATVAVIGLLKRGFDEAKEAADRRIDAEEEYIRVTATLTSDEIQAKREQAEVERQIAASTVARLSELRDAYIQAEADGTNLEENWLDLSASLGLANADLAAINESLESNIDAYRESAESIGAYDRALQSSEVAARDAAKAEEERLAALQASIDASAQTFRSTLSFLSGDNIDNSAIDERLDAIERDREIIQETIETYNLSEEALSSYQAQLEQLAVEEETLSTRGREIAAARAEEAAALERQETAQRQRLEWINRSIAEEIRYGELLESGTAQGVRDRIGTLERERTAIQNMLPTLQELAEYSDEAAEELEGYYGRLFNISNELGQLNSDVLPVLETRENFERMIQTAQEASDLARQRTEAVRQAEEDIREIQEQTAERIADLYAKQAEKIADAQQRLGDELSKAEQKRFEDTRKALEEANRGRVDAQRDRNRALADLEKDLAKQREDILLSSQRSTNNAIAARDALSAAQAQQQEEDELKQLKEDGRDRRKEIRDNYRDQLREIQERLDEQRLQIQRSYDAQVQSARNTYYRTVTEAINHTNQMVSQERFKNQQLVAERNAALDEELYELGNFREAGTYQINQFVTNSIGLLRDLANAPNTMGGSSRGVSASSANNPILYNSNVGTSQDRTFNVNTTVSNSFSTAGLSPQEIRQVQQVVWDELGIALESA